MGEDGGIGGGDIGGRGRSEGGNCGGRDPVEMRRLNHQSPGNTFFFLLLLEIEI